MPVIRKVVIMLIGILIASLVTIVMPAPEAYAGECSGPSKFFCGAVKNSTGRAINITYNLRDRPNRKTPHWCDVWNYRGRLPWDRSWYRAACFQEPPLGNETYGGNGTNVDVDAFTFANHGYHVRHGRFLARLGPGLLGIWHWENQGVWTKVRDGEIAECGIGDNNEVWCTVLLQP